MAQLLHGSATTTARTRAKFQHSEGPRERRSTVLTPFGEAVIIAFRVRTSPPARRRLVRSQAVHTGAHSQYAAPLSQTPRRPAVASPRPRALVAGSRATGSATST